MLRGYKRAPKGAAVFDDAKRWEGWGTALKPAHEPVALARKPLKGTVAANVLAHGAGALNIDACRVNWQSSADAAAAAAQRVCRDEPGRERWAGHGGAFLDPHGSLATWQEKADLGRWPANVMTDRSLDVLEAFPSSARDAIRFFYAPKADKAEREFGMENTQRARNSGVGALRDGARTESMRANIHPTVKPIDLMAWLCRLTTAPGGTIIEPFMGSGSTGIAAVRHGFRFVGIEQSPEYFDIALRRIRAAVEAEATAPRFEAAITRAVRAVQQDMFAGAS